MLTEELVNCAKKHLESKNGSKAPFEVYNIGENQALFLLTGYGSEVFPSLKGVYEPTPDKHLTESDFEKALVASKVPFNVALAQKRLYLVAPSKNYSLEVFSSGNVSAGKENYKAQYPKKSEVFEKGNQIVKNRHPGQRKAASKKDPSKVNIKLDILYQIQNEGSEAQYLLGEVKAYPYTDKSKIERRAGQITTYDLCLGQINNCNDLTLIFPTLPSSREVKRYLNEPVKEQHNLHIITITERDYLQADIKRRTSLAKRNVGRHHGVGWEEELSYLKETAEITGLEKI